METFKKILHVIVPPANIVVASLLTTINLVSKNEENTDTYKNIISGVAFLQVVLTILNQIYSKLMKGEEAKLKNEVVEKETIIKELSVVVSNSNRSINMSSLRTSEAGSDAVVEVKPQETPKTEQENNNHIYEYKTPY